MVKMQHPQDTAPQPGSPEERPASIWPGFLLGFLLVSFLLTFVYSGYLLYRWARAAVSKAPESPLLNVTALAAQMPTATVEPVLTPPSVMPATPVPNTWDPWRKERVNILLLGIDQRPSEKGPARTDTMIVLSLDPATGQASMLSIPRDLWVRIPTYDIFGKINTTHVIGEQRGYPGGGPALAKQTVSELIGYPIHYYVKINFDGFRRVIDLIGGIDIYVPQDINDPTFPDDNFGYDPLFIPAGQHHMDGELALKYARTRHVDDDYGRAHRQQQVILAIKEQVMRTDLIPSLIMRLPQLTRAFAGSVETDIPLDKAVALVNLARHLDLENVKQAVIDRSLGEERNDPNLGYILIPNREAIRPLMDELFGSVPSTTVIKASEPPIGSISVQQADQLTAERADIAVLDGANRPEMATYVAGWLKTQGFQVTEVGEAERMTYPRTVVRIFVPKPYTVSRLQALLGQVEIQDLSGTVAAPPRDIEVVLGEDFDPTASAP